MATTPGPRERLLETGQRLFYERGASVGVETLLTEASVARRSLYEHFGGKDGLIEAVLQRAAADDLTWYQAALARATDPRERLLGLFDQLDELVATPDFRGCRYFATDLALSEPDHPAHAHTAAFRSALRDLLVVEVRAAGHDNPDAVAEQLHLLIEGTLVMGATSSGSQHPGHAARELAAAALS